VDKHGKEQVLVWRRSYDIPPPDIDEDSEYFPGNDPMYANVPKEDLPRSESLKLTEERFMGEWKNTLIPEIKSGKKILIAAHGNTLRALVKNLDNISSDEITGLNIPTGKKIICWILSRRRNLLRSYNGSQTVAPRALETNHYSSYFICSCSSGNQS
jgi:2,3-bisphosphoglycerate-dependent phosphoglycerate mutase